MATTVETATRAVPVLLRRSTVQRQESTGLGARLLPERDAPGPDGRRRGSSLDQSGPLALDFPGTTADPRALRADSSGRALARASRRAARSTTRSRVGERPAGRRGDRVGRGRRLLSPGDVAPSTRPARATASSGSSRNEPELAFERATAAPAPGHGPDRGRALSGRRDSPSPSRASSVCRRRPRCRARPSIWAARRSSGSGPSCRPHARLNSLPRRGAACAPHNAVAVTLVVQGDRC